MSSLQQDLLELTALTQLYLLQEFSRKDWLGVDLDTYTYFKQKAKQNKEPIKPAPIIPQQTFNAPGIKSVETKPNTVNKPSKAAASIPENIPALPKSKEPAIALEEPLKPSIKQQQLELHPLPQASAINLSDIRNIVATHFPNLTILDAPLDDSEAKKLNQAWRKPKTCAQVVILSFDDDAKQHIFLTQVAKAISDRFAAAEVITVNHKEQSGALEKLIQANELRLILASPHCLQSIPELRNHYRQKASQDKHDFLGNIPFILLSDIKAYLSDTQLKATLWRTLCDFLK